MRQPGAGRGGGVVRGSARETDVVARFGGDEFALILPDTGREGAFAVGERIRERIAAHSFLAADGLDIHLTASVGVATLPDVASTPDELMQAADMAMYQVKESGKNGIQAAPLQPIISRQAPSVETQTCASVLSQFPTPARVMGVLGAHRGFRLSGGFRPTDVRRPTIKGASVESSFDAFVVFE